MRHPVLRQGELKMTPRSIVRWSVGAIFLLSAQLANAQPAGQSPPLPPSAISAFLANPGQLLNQFPNGGPGLAKQVADLMSSDKITLATLIAFAKTANEDQRKAIAQGLAQAAKAYASASGDPGFANQIQQAVANSGLPEFAKNYADAAGDTGTASTGGGNAGGGGPSGTGAPTGGQNNGTFPVTNGTPNRPIGGSTPTVTGGFFSQNTGTTINQLSQF
jgi:hypothetical protein